MIRLISSYNIFCCVLVHDDQSSPFGVAEIAALALSARLNRGSFQEGRTQPYDGNSLITKGENSVSLGEKLHWSICNWRGCVTYILQQCN